MMQPADDWNFAEGDRVSRFGEGGIGLLRTTLLFGSAAAALALILTPLLDTSSRDEIAQNRMLGLDTMSTGNVGYRGVYTIRKSVLQASPTSVCIIRDNGTRSGDC